MAYGRDPNRDFEPDPETSAEEVRRGGGLGDLKSTRLGLSSWATVLIVALVTAGILTLLF